MPTDTPEPLSDAVPKYSAREIADWRKKHVPVILRGPEPQKHCGFDDAPWPCFTIAALNGWDALLAAREELEQAKADIMELMAEKLPDGTTLHRMVTTYPKMHQRMLGDADNEIAKLRQRAETAEANCAALRQALERTVPVCSCPSCRGHRSILASPNPGAGLAGRAGAGPEAHRGAGGWSPLSEISKRAACYRMIAAMPDEEMAYIANLLAQPASYYLPEAMDLIAELEANP